MPIILRTVCEEENQLLGDRGAAAVSAQSIERDVQTVRNVRAPVDTLYPTSLQCVQDLRCVGG